MSISHAFRTRFVHSHFRPALIHFDRSHCSRIEQTKTTNSFSFTVASTLRLHYVSVTCGKLNSIQNVRRIKCVRNADNCVRAAMQHRMRRSNRTRLNLFAIYYSFDDLFAHLSIDLSDATKLPNLMRWGHTNTSHQHIDNISWLHKKVIPVNVASTRIRDRLGCRSCNGSMFVR